MGADILSKIIAERTGQIQAAQKMVPETVLRKKAENRTDYRAFMEPFVSGPDDRVNIIAEIKRASPSKGIIRADLDAASCAVAYENGGAVALSVLTEPAYFQGSIEDLQAARDATRLPVLRKDFTVSTYQIYETAAIGADALLLIVRVLLAEQLKDYLDLARELHIDALVEVHTLEDMEIATESGATLIGINNRNLKSFDTDIRTAMDMVARFSPGQVPVAASGITSRADIDANLKAGIRNFLVGESLVRAADPEKKLRELIHA